MKINDPTRDPDEISYLTNVLDAFCDEAKHYNVRAFAKEFPYLRPIYEAQGRIGKDEVLE